MPAGDNGGRPEGVHSVDTPGTPTRAPAPFPGAAHRTRLDGGLVRAAERIADAAVRDGRRLSKRGLDAALRADGQGVGRVRLDALWAHLETRATAPDGFTTAEVVTGKGVTDGYTPGRPETSGATELPSADPPAGVGTADPTRRPLWVTLLTVVVGLVALGSSYGHQVELARMAGEPELIAYAVPLSVDGLAVAAFWAGRRGRWWLVLALVASLGANVAAAEPTLAGRVVAAWPPLSLLGCHHLLTQREPLDEAQQAPSAA